jgi:hypothetical protein
VDWAAIAVKTTALATARTHTPTTIAPVIMILPFLVPTYIENVI